MAFPLDPNAPTENVVNRLARRALTELDLRFDADPFGAYNPWKYPDLWGRVLPRDIDDVVEQPLGDDLIAWIRDNPQTFKPFRPYYVKTHDNAPGTVRAWFRAMRAEEFKRDVGWSYLPLVWSGAPWTLFDTQKVVDRVTAWVYPQFEIAGIFFTDADGRVVATRCAPDGMILPERSPYPLFSSKLPTSSRGLTLEDIQKFIKHDDAHRSDRRVSATVTSPLAWRCRTCGSAAIYSQVNNTEKFAETLLCRHQERQIEDAAIDLGVPLTLQNYAVAFYHALWIDSLRGDPASVGAGDEPATK